MIRPRTITEEQFTAMQANVQRGKGRRVSAGVASGRSRGQSDDEPGRIKRALQDGGCRVRNPAPSPTKFRSKWESAYSAKLDLELRAGLIKAYWYEPFSLWLPGKVRYKPDFMVQYKVPLYQVNITDYVPQLEIIEVKGFSRNRRDGITRLKIAAALFPCFVWRMVWRTKGGGWDGMYVGQ
jgi:hypothetical protein